MVIDTGHALALRKETATKHKSPSEGLKCSYGNDKTSMIRAKRQHMNAGSSARHASALPPGKNGLRCHELWLLEQSDTWVRSLKDRPAAKLQYSK